MVLTALSAENLICPCGCMAGSPQVSIYLWYYYGGQKLSISIDSFVCEVTGKERLGGGVR